MSDARRVVMFVSNPAASDPRVNKQARVLAENGFRVSVLGWDRAGDVTEREVVDGVSYERLGPRCPYGGGWRNLPRFREYWARAARRAIELQADAVHCHDLDTAPAGLAVLRRRPATRLVVDYHELYMGSPMVPQRGVIGALARGGVGLLDRRVVSRADLLVVANPGNRPRYERLAPNKLVIVENAPDASRFRPRDHRPDGPFTVCYIGNKRYATSLRRLISIVSSHDDMRALLAGGGSAQVEIDALAADVPNVDTVGPVAYEDIPGLYGSCDAVYALYDPSMRNIQTSFPVKAMEGMACGLPVLVDAGTWVGDFIEREGAGLAVDSTQEGAVEDALVRLKDDEALRKTMGDKGRRVVERELSWEVAAARLVAAYGGLWDAADTEHRGRRS